MATVTQREKIEARRLLDALYARTRRLYERADPSRRVCETCGNSHLDTSTKEYAAWANAATEMTEATVQAITEKAITIERACTAYDMDRVILASRVRIFELHRDRDRLDG